MFVRVPFFPGISSPFSSIASSQQPVRLANVRLVELGGESGAGGGGGVWANIGLGHTCCPYQEPDCCY